MPDMLIKHWTRSEKRMRFFRVTDRMPQSIIYVRTTTKSAPADFEFIVARHCSGRELLRIWDGKVSANLDQIAIDDARIRDKSIRASIGVVIIGDSEEAIEETVLE